MFLRIEDLPPTQLVGMSITNTLANDQTFKLWSRFMPRRKEIKDPQGNSFYAVQVYHHQGPLTPETPFEKWATMAVPSFENIPEGMKSLLLPAGLYAVFQYRGLAKDFPQLMQYIFGSWMPASDYAMDDRPHFELLGEKYKRSDPDSEEEVWIPVRLREQD